MADGTRSPSASPTATEDAALQEALAAAHVAIWGYGVVGAALPPESRDLVVACELAYLDLRDQLLALLSARQVEPVDDEPGYTLPFPVLSPVDAAALAVTLEEGSSAAWTWVLDQATERSTRQFGVAALGAAELRAVGWRIRAGRTPPTTAFPGLPEA
ncbi:ferritin-like domain-containing protein [Modestobacter sp. VKM Ac-2984]|uniref:ferritin-like domain-containing protein n=1 Tax=Modestobacter sp. VKM Ac-2984 TaxID=3004138 RepID=UPI0022AAC160|nr:ferritin-like domain-containing protein [Modestobacter sp. VKM Ac-2984]MCZ2816739.1 ferritin-like domain-containing protein [Modestobacter sp. VKM Ac-2984]